MRLKKAIYVVAAATAVLSACGGDDDDDTAASDAPSASTGAAATEAAPTTMSGTAPVESAPTGSAGTAPVPDEICALATQMFEQESFPTEAQLTKYQELAPAEIEAQVNAAAGALLAVVDDPVALFNAFGDDEIEVAIADIDAWEEENCDIPHSEQSALPAGASREIEDGATRVDVTATDYAFELGPVEAGRTSFVMTNEGAEAHFLLVVKLAEGTTLDDFMASETGEGGEGFWETNVASGGGDEETITFDVEPGNYGLLCFVPTADGTPHAMLGMMSEITVA